MKSSRLLVSGLLLAGLLQIPRPLSAQKAEVLQVQRDLYDFQHKVEEWQKAQDEKMANLDAELRQAIEANAKLSASLAGLQTNLAQSLTKINSMLDEQQGKITGPIANMSAKVDQMSSDFGAVRNSVDALGRRLTGLDDKLTDIKSAVAVLSAPPPPPPAVEPAPTQTQSQTSTDGPAPPPGFSAAAAFARARSDYISGKYDLARDEFIEYLKYAGDTEHGPDAYYYLGDMYFKNKQYEDAVKAFDAVLERYPQNARSADASFGKADALMHGGQRTEAAEEFKNFLDNYPADPRAASARAKLKELGMSAKPATRRGKSGQ
jgi:TolA-binding protein